MTSLENQPICLAAKFKKLAISDFYLIRNVKQLSETSIEVQMQMQTRLFSSRCYSLEVLSRLYVHILESLRGFALSSRTIIKYLPGKEGEIFVFFCISAKFTFALHLNLLKSSKIVLQSRYSPTTTTRHPSKKNKKKTLYISTY